EHMAVVPPKYLARLKGRIAQEVTNLLDAMAPHAGEEIDMVEHFSARLPLYTLCEVLGVPEPDRPKFLEWMHYLERAQDLAMQQRVGTLQLSPDLLTFIGAFNSNVEEMFAYGRDILKKRRAEPREDLLTAIAHAKLDAELLA